MAAFSTLYNEVAEIIGDTSAGMITRVKEWINFAQQEVATAAFWPWLLKEDLTVLTAELNDSEETCTVTNGDATVDFGSEVLPAAMGVGQYYFKAGSDSEWYPVASRTDADTCELAQAYQGTTDADATYIARRMFYSLPSDCWAIASYRNMGSPRYLKCGSYADLDWIDPDNDETGTDTFLYIPFGVDANGYPQVSFYPVPIAANVYHLRYFRKLTDLSSDSDVSLIPAPFHEILKYGALKRAYEFTEDNAGMQRNEVRFARLLHQMKQTSLSGPNDAVVVGRPVSSGARDLLSRLVLPVSES